MKAGNSLPAATNFISSQHNKKYANLRIHKHSLNLNPMARPSKLTEKQWIEITERVARNESMRALSKEFKVSEAAIRQQVSTRAKLIKDVANQMVAAEVAFKSLPVTSQIIAHNLADELRQITMHLSSAAKNGAAVANRLSGMAARHTDLIDDADLNSEGSVNAIKTVNALMRTANESSALAVDLIKSNKDAIKVSDDKAADSTRDLTDEELNAELEKYGIK